MPAVSLVKDFKWILNSSFKYLHLIDKLNDLYLYIYIKDAEHWTCQTCAIWQLYIHQL